VEYVSPLVALSIHVMLYGIMLGWRSTSESGSVLPRIHPDNACRENGSDGGEGDSGGEPEVEEIVAVLAMTDGLEARRRRWRQV